MFKWISTVGINLNNTLDSASSSGLFNNSIQLQLSDSSVSILSKMNVISYDYQWMPNMIDTNNDIHTVDEYNPPDDTDKSITNHFRPINSDLCVSLIDSNDIDFDQYFSFTNVMSDREFYNSDNIQNQMELGEKILKHKKSSNFGFTALQKRIERVKSDLKNLTNKLSPNNSVSNESEQSNFCYYNMALGKANENEDSTFNDDLQDVKAPDKTWKCPSQFKDKNPFSDLSESTQKILGRLRLKEEEPDESQSVEKEYDELEMEEDELEFTFTQRPTSFLGEFMSKGTLSVIEEQDEDDSSSDDSESAKSTVIERMMPSADDTIALNSSSMHSADVTDSDSYATPMSSFRVTNDKHESTDDTEEYFSDFAKCSVSSLSNASLRSHEVDKFEISCTETTIKAENDFGPLSEHDSSLEDKSSSSLKGDEDFASEAEYDNSGWSTEDIPQSVEQSDSLYDKPFRSMLKSSLPDLLESSDGHDIDNLGGSLILRHYNKSTDLDEVLDQISPYRESPSATVGRLSQSMSNLFLAKPRTVIRPDDFFLERASFDNLMETDLDSGYVSIYKPVQETEILPKMDFSCSMGNVNQNEGSFNGLSAPLVERLRKKAGSVTELRIADSLSKLSIPNWLNLNDDDDDVNNDKYDGLDYNATKNNSLPVQHSPTSLDRTLLSSQRRMKSLPRPIPVIKPKVIPMPVVLPSQLLRLSSQNSNSKIAPIKFCQARSLLLPSKVTVNSLKQSIKL